MAGLFAQHAATVGLAANTSSFGFGAKGEPPTGNTVRLLAARGLDVSEHRSRHATTDEVLGAHLIVTAERGHVVSIAGRWPASFVHTFTLPELVERGEAVGARGDQTIAEWLRTINEGRPTALDYLEAEIAEIADPTGQSPSVWTSSFNDIDDLTRRLSELLA